MERRPALFVFGRYRRSLAPLALAVLGALHAQTQPGASPTYNGDDLRIREVFTSHLPQTLRAGGLRFSVHPHLGDFNIRDYLRVTTGVRYGLTSRWESSIEAEGYLSHGFGDVGFFKRIGFSTLGFGTKYNLGEQPIPSWNTAIGFDFATPVGQPPADLTDGMRHYHPYLVASRRLTAHPDIRVFWGAGVDLVQHTDRPRKLQDNQLDDNATVLSAGAVWDRRSVHYTFEMSWASTRVLGHGQDDTLTLRPGIIWEVPWFSSRHPGRNILLGAALRAGFGPDGTDLGVGAKLRINFDPKQGRRKPETTPEH
ncbi:MAG TPA: hypothetical protein VK178_01150 [Opitutaceae bacterium]|nr:hypothetical protein [Opitutaceae bacterium]